MTNRELNAALGILSPANLDKPAVAFILVPNPAGVESSFFRTITEVLIEFDGRPVIVTGRESVP